MSEHDHSSCSCGCCHEQEHNLEHCSCGHEHHHEHIHGPSCGCGHEHSHESSLKRSLIRIIVSAVLLIVAALLPLGGWLRFLAFLVPYAVIGYDVLWGAVRNITRGHVFDEHFLMALATVGAFAIGESAEATFVMLFYQVGELFQSYAAGQSRRSIAALMDIRPDWANVERENGLEQVDPESVRVDEIIVVKPGERIPLDGIVIEGVSALDTAALTGESLPRDAAAGDEVISGCVNLSGLLRIRVSKAYAQSTVARILDLVENASGNKAKAENFITKFARYYTPAMVCAAVLLAVLPPLLGGGTWGKWIYQALSFLVVSCPCALVLSVPLSFFGGIGGASKAGILIKGGSFMEMLARADVVVMDKTGTLTQGVFQVTSIHPEHCTERELLELAALAEFWSDHPISRSIKSAWAGEPDVSRVTDAQELPGRGVRVKVDHQIICAGNERLMNELGIPCSPVTAIGTVVHVAREGKYLGHLVVSDMVKADAKQAIAALKASGVRKTVMLTGDAKAVGEAVGTELGLDQIYTQLLPGSKVELIEQLLSDTGRKGSLLFVGDGINDAPALSRADVGIAMGALGSDAAIEAADVVLMDDKPSKIAQAISIARRTLGIAKQNIIFALGVKAIVLLLAALSAAPMWLAVFADVGVAAIAILNAMRALSTR